MQSRRSRGWKLGLASFLALGWMSNPTLREPLSCQNSYSFIEGFANVEAQTGIATLLEKTMRKLVASGGGCVLAQTLPDESLGNESAVTDGELQTRDEQQAAQVEGNDGIQFIWKTPVIADSEFRLRLLDYSSLKLSRREIPEKTQGLRLSTQDSVPLAQTPIPPPTAPPIPPQDLFSPPTKLPPVPEPTPSLPSSPLLPLEEPLPSQTPTPSTPEVSPGNVPIRLNIKQFQFIGNTAFTDEELAEVIKQYKDQPITFDQLLEARSAIAQFYIDHGYDTSGAYIPIRPIENGVVTIQIVEGRLEDIQVKGTQRLNPNYVRSRLEIATRPPLNRHRLLNALRLLQADPLLKNISAELAAGTRPGTNLLIVRVQEANSFNFQLTGNNGRSPSVGSFRRGVQLTEANLLGLGDKISVGYTNTDGSNGIDFSYTLPINPRNGTLSFSYGTASSQVIEPPFNTLDIQSSSRYYDLTLRQPLVQTPTLDFSLGLTASRRESEAVFLEDLLGEAFPFPAVGADEEGKTRVSALRFSQDLTLRGSNQVFALASQFSLGIGAFDATLNKNPPDSRFFSWRGQAQYVRLLAPDTLLVVRGDVQLADRPLLPIEQFGLGGQSSVRGYRQDVLLTDNGALASAELRLPILRIPQWRSVLQLTPFVDAGTTWNSSGDSPNSSSLASVGLGLLWQQGDRFTARLDWGIPLVDVDSRRRTWQENGVYFSITVNAF